MNRLSLFFLFILMLGKMPVYAKDIIPNLVSFSHPLSVEIAEVKKQEDPLYIQTVGIAHPSLRIEIKPQVTGRLIHSYIKGGEEVAVGALLFEIDPLSYEVALEKAKALMKQHQADLEFAKIKLGRYLKLAEKGFVSKLAIDEYLNQVKSLEEQVAVAHCEVEQAALYLSYCKIVSPIKGRTSLDLMNEGNMVTEDDVISGLTTIVQTDPIHVTFSVSEKEFQVIKALLKKEKLPIKVSLLHGGNKEFKGQIECIDNKFNTDTSTIQLKAVVPNPDSHLWPGESVNVQIPIKMESHLCLIPHSAIHNNQEGSFVYRVKEDKTVEIRPIKTGEKVEDSIIVKQGLEPGMQIVIGKDKLLHAGDKVTIINSSLQ